MIYVGIDIAKMTHVAAVNADGVIIIEPFFFANNHEGFKLLKSKLETIDKSKVLISLDSTAHYAENVIFFLHSLFELAVINPVQTADMRKTYIRKTKTDKVDSLLICKTLMVNFFRHYTENDIKTLKLKFLCRFRQNLKKSKAHLKIQLTSYVDVIFPELQSFFKSGLHIKTCYELLKVCYSPDDIAALHLTKLSNILSKAFRGRFWKQDAQSPKSLAASSVGVKNTYISIQIAQTIAKIELIESQLTELETFIKVAVDALDSVIMTVPGIGKLNGAMILGEIGDIKRFSNSSKLLAYAGLDHVINQSGKFNAKRTLISKRGSKLLRYTLINAAWNVSLNNDTFKRYYDSKVAQGLSHYSALGHTAHKFVRVLLKLLNNNITFALAWFFYFSRLFLLGCTLFGFLKFLLILAFFYWLLIAGLLKMVVIIEYSLYFIFKSNIYNYHMPQLYVKLKVYPFTYFYIIRHNIQFFVTFFLPKSAKLTKST